MGVEINRNQAWGGLGGTKIALGGLLGGPWVHLGSS